MPKALMLAAILAISACQTTRGSYCDITKPIRLSDAAVDALSDAEVARVLSHNEKLATLCGVKP